MDSEDSGAAAEQAWNEGRLSRPVTAPCWRLWCYSAPAIVFGCAQSALYEAARRAGNPVALVRRRSGGGAVLTGRWMVGLSVVLPPFHDLAATSPMAAYRWLGETLASVLRDCGAGAVAMPPGARARDRSLEDGLEWACFGAVSSWEVALAGRKIAGLAQRRSRNGVLLVAGLLLEPPDWAMLCRCLARPEDDARRLSRLTTSLREARGEASGAPILIGTLRRRLERVMGVREFFQGKDNDGAQHESG